MTRMAKGKAGDVGIAHAVLGAIFILFFAGSGYALTGENVLVLVNEQSPAGRYIAKLYREYHPDIPESQVLYLSGLADCAGPSAGPADEILTRDQYETLIADPVRQYLLDESDPERLSRIMVIVTTAGLPYRIEDANPSFANAVYPGGSDPMLVVSNEAQISAATVESDLSCLWFLDYGATPLSSMNRLVNPYQGYRNTPVEWFERLGPDAKPFSWTASVSTIPSIARPRIEGHRSGYGAVGRSLHAGDIYLTCRLDGNKNKGQSPVFAVRAMLERARIASTNGIDPRRAVIYLDDAPDSPVGNVNWHRTFNLDSGVDFLYFIENYNPWDTTTVRMVDDFDSLMKQCAGLAVMQNQLNIGLMDLAWGAWICSDTRPGGKPNMDELDLIAAANPDRTPQQGVLFLSTYGTNGGEGYARDYIHKGGPGGGALVRLMNGAVFTSIESLNAVSMFSDVTTSPVAQGKIVDFIAAGGCGAIGHAFEPQTDAIINCEFLAYNLFVDEDGDGYADLTFIEAAFSALPYLSWCEVVIGDPLMRLRYDFTGTSDKFAWNYFEGDADNNCRVTFSDLWDIQMHMSGRLDMPEYFDLYDDMCDMNHDGRITFNDLWIANCCIGARKE